MPVRYPSLFIIVVLLLLFTIANGQRTRYSTESEVGCTPCFDTIKLFGIKTIQDVNRIMPTWVPVAGKDTVVVLEGMVKSGVDKFGINNGPLVSYEDLPLFHYTHDMCFNVTPDSAFQHMLAYQVFTGTETHIVEEFDGVRKPGDTTRQHDVHVEWESGLGQSNPGNPCAALNRLGKSCGFSTTGHQRGDYIWNWPTTGDWVHIEGLWIWDRGHPPAEAEIHPIRFLAIQRALPAKISIDGPYATLVDIYASGNGGTFYNNLPGQPAFVNPVKMAGRTYNFTVKNTLPKPSANAKLLARLEKAQGNSYNGNVNLAIDQATGLCNVSIPWTDADTAVLAYSLYLYWDEDTGTTNGAVNRVKVHVKKLKIKKRKEFLTPSEFRVFMDVGGNWLFLNDLFGTKKDVLDKGLGKTYRRNFKIEDDFYINVPSGKDFRIYVTGWEADGMDLSFGHIVDDHSPCNADTKQMLHKSDKLNLKQVALHGCLDDHFGDAAAWHKVEGITTQQKFELLPQEGVNIDVCPCSKFKMEKGFKLYYTIEKVN
jgi:hypothetical protein